MLNEARLRRESYDPEYAVKLNDGQTWYLPSPKIRVTPVRDADGKPGSREISGLGSEYVDRVHAYQRSVTAWQESSEGDTAAFDGMIAHQLDLAIALIQANYDIDYDQAAELIAIDFEDSAQIEQLRMICRFAQGVSPKRLAVGSSPGSEPTA